MKALLLVAWSLAAAAPVLAQEGRPSEESLQRLLSAVHADRILDAYLKQMDAGMQAGMREALKGKAPTAKQQQIIDDMRSRMVAVLRESLSWDKLEPAILEIYRQNLTQVEVNDMLRFYESPTGRSVVDKLPAIMQQSGQIVQGMVPSMVAKLQAISKEAVEQLKTAGGN